MLEAGIPRGWTECQLEDVAAVVRGITFPATAKSKTPAAGKAMCLRTSNVQAALEFDDVLYVPKQHVRRSDQWLRAGDTVMSMANSYDLVGKVALASQPAPDTTIGGFLAIIRPSGVEPRFVYYQLASTRVQEALRRTASHTVNISNLSVRSLHRVVLRLAPRPEQQGVVEEIDSYLTRLDDAIVTLERVQRNLKRYRASVLKAAVEGRLVPTEAELARAEGRDYEPASVLLERILAERRRRWEEAELARMKAKGKAPKDDQWKDRYPEPAQPDTSDLPELPEGWCWTALGTLIISGPQNGIYVPQSRYGHGTPILRIGDFQMDDSRSSGEFRKIDLPGSEVDGYLLRVGDLVVNRVNSPSHLGKTLAIEERHLPAVFESNMMRFEVSRGIIPGYVQHYLSSIEGKRRLIRSAKWAVNQASINQGDLSRTPVPLPPTAEQERVIAAIDLLLSTAGGGRDAAVLSSARCSRLRQAILKWAFEGKLVEQDPNDEPASVLLERIRAEREATDNAAGPRLQRRARGKRRSR